MGSPIGINQLSKLFIAKSLFILLIDVKNYAVLPKYENTLTNFLNSTNIYHIYLPESAETIEYAIRLTYKL